MKKLTFLLSLLSSVSYGFMISPEKLPEDLSKISAQEIVELMQEYNSTYTAKTGFTQQIRSGGKVIDNRNGVIKSIKYKAGGKILDKTLFRFTTSVKRGVTFLSIEREGDKDNDQYLYIPALKRPRKLASTEKQNDFEDTDFTNEDLGGLTVTDYTYKKKRKLKSIDGIECIVIIAKAKDKGARFPKKKIYVSRKHLLPIQVQYYDRDKKVDRILKASDIKEFKVKTNKRGVIYLATTLYAKNLKSNHETILKIPSDQIELELVLSESDFTSSRMNLGW